MATQRPININLNFLSIFAVAQTGTLVLNETAFVDLSWFVLWYPTLVSVILFIAMMAITREYARMKE